MYWILYGRWTVGAMLEFPDLNHFHFLPPNHMNTGKHRCSGRSDNAPLQESASEFSWQKTTRSNDHPENNPFFLFFFFYPRTNTLTPWRERNEHYKMGLQRENLAYSYFLKNSKVIKVIYLVKIHVYKKRTVNRRHARNYFVILLLTASVCLFGMAAGLMLVMLCCPQILFLVLPPTF